MPVLLAWAGALPAQEVIDLATSSTHPRQTQETTEQPDGLEGLIRIDVAVRDGSRQPVSGLTANDFTLLDNEQPQKLISFHAASGGAKAEDDVEVVLVLDEVNLASDQVKEARHAIGEYLLSGTGRLAHPTLVYVVSPGGLSVTSGPSRDGHEIAGELAAKKGLRLIWQREVLELMNQLQGIEARNLRNSVSLNALGSIVVEARRRPRRKLVFWIGNGWPAGDGCEDSFEWITEFSTRIREARVVLSGLSAWRGPGDFDDKRMPEGAAGMKQKSARAMSLDVLATQSGGGLFSAASDWGRTLDEAIAQESRYYTLSFDPPRARDADEYHALRVKLKDASLAAKTSAGYYDQPVFYDDPPIPTVRVSVAELAALLQTLHEPSDGEGAKRLEGVELTERMSVKQLNEWKGRMRGAKSRAALVRVADASSFLDPPAEKTGAAAPGLDEQRRIMTKTVEYVRNAIGRLPNFYAVRTIERYRQGLQKEGESWKIPPKDQELQQKGVLNATMFYRDGAEVADASGMGKKNVAAQEKMNTIANLGFGHSWSTESSQGMDTRGTFGPILSTVILDAARSHLQWRGWEQHADGMRAAFKYAVPEEKSHYEVTYCCLAEGNGTTVFRKLSAYHGEIQINPETGAIVRLTVQADVGPRLPIVRSDILVDYAPQTLGNVEYMCPAHSVTIWRGRRSEDIHEWNESFRGYGPFETMMDDVTFDRYHLFRGETRILSEEEAAKAVR